MGETLRCSCPLTTGDDGSLDESDGQGKMEKVLGFEAYLEVGLRGWIGHGARKEEAA